VEEERRGEERGREDWIGEEERRERHGLLRFDVMEMGDRPSNEK
jgi:hypothetical protein